MKDGIGKQIFQTKIEERFVLGNTIEKHNGSNSIDIVR
jgi:hypothetical protein